MSINMWHESWENNFTWTRNRADVLNVSRWLQTLARYTYGGLVLVATFWMKIIRRSKKSFRWKHLIDGNIPQMEALLRWKCFSDERSLQIQMPRLHKRYPLWDRGCRRWEDFIFSGPSKLLARGAIFNICASFNVAEASEHWVDERQHELTPGMTTAGQPTSMAEMFWDIGWCTIET
jgi:hypothetical protein